MFDDATELTKQLLTQYSKGEIGEVYIAYTNFKNTVTQEAKLMKLLRSGRKILHRSSQSVTISC